MEYTVQKLANLAGISSRTLRYYDSIGLLKPSRVTASGYRIYGEAEVDALQQILFYRELGMELSQISTILQTPSFDRLAALKQHRKALLQRQQHLNLLINTVEKTIANEEGKISMSDTEKFEGFKRAEIEENEYRYGRELREKYGDAAIDESNAKRVRMSEQEYNAMKDLEGKLLDALKQAVSAGEDPKGESGREIARMHQSWLCYTWPHYTREAHLGLVQMYTEDERFSSYYDRELPGCAQFLRDAVTANVCR